MIVTKKLPPVLVMQKKVYNSSPNSEIEVHQSCLRTHQTFNSKHLWVNQVSVKTLISRSKPLTNSLVGMVRTDNTGMAPDGELRRINTLINSEQPTDWASISLSLSTRLSYATITEE